jgi:predicted Zn-dependent protease
MKPGFLVAIVAVVAFGAASVHGDMFKPSKADQVKLGRRAAADLRKEVKLLPDTDKRVVLMRRLGAELLAAMKIDKKEPWEYTFDVVDDKQLNAFALPGGPVFIYRGLLDKLQTEDQFAAVLGHEMTHVRREHWAYAYADGEKRRLGLTVLLTVMRANDNVFGLADVSDELLFDLPYSRKHENEADAGGCDAVAAAGYNPKGMIEVFGILREGTGGGKMPEFMSDHPSEVARIKLIQDRIAKMNRPFPPERPLDFK